jgi:NAD(P)-dependent dehydrogenase (short-subunit alcohol dehydrogenase family)
MALKQKVALVTGSALNIGRQTALHLAIKGYRVATTAHPRRIWQTFPITHRPRLWGA